MENAKQYKMKKVKPQAASNDLLVKPNNAHATGKICQLGSKRVFLSDHNIQTINLVFFGFTIMAAEIEHEVLVCDNGTGFVKCGFAGEVRLLFGSQFQYFQPQRHTFFVPLSSRRNSLSLLTHHCPSFIMSTLSSFHCPLCSSPSNTETTGV